MHPVGAAARSGWLPPSGGVAGGEMGRILDAGAATGRRVRRVAARINSLHSPKRFHNDLSCMQRMCC